MLNQQELVYEPYLGFWITREDRRNLVVVKFTKWKSLERHCLMLCHKYVGRNTLIKT